MAAFRTGIFVVAAARTPFGAYGGLLKSKTCTDLAELAARACLEQSTRNSETRLLPKHVESVVLGNVVQTHADTAYLARHVGLRVGLPLESSALTVNRLCGSGFQAVISAAHDIVSGTTQIAMAGGSESMSGAPFAARGIRFGTQFGLDYKLEDTLWATLEDRHIKTPMGITAENLAEKYAITREECDALALRSQQRWRKAHEAGVFEPEICPIKLSDKKGAVVEMNRDEHPRDTTLEDLAKLKPVFKKNGVVTAGNASGVTDGAAVLLLASEEAVIERKLEPLARLVGYAVVGCDPAFMGIGPVGALDKLMKVVVPGKCGRDVADYFDLVEVNEAFAAQYLGVERELHLNPDRTNTHGGAIALGHPVGASGARILAHLSHQLAKHKGQIKRVVGSACIGGGQGIAVMLQAV